MSTMTRDSRWSVRIRYNCNESLYRSIHFIPSPEREVYKVAIILDGRALLLQGCRLNQENHDFDMIDVENFNDYKSTGYNQGCIELHGMPQICTSLKPVAISLFQGEFYNFYTENEPKVFNVCGKIMTMKKGMEEDIFNAKYLPCLINRESQLVNISHIHGSLRYKKNRNIIMFKGFSAFDKFHELVHDAIKEEVLQNSEARLDMVLIHCNLGKYVGVAQDCFLQRQLTKTYGDCISFMPRTDEQNNKLNFKIQDLGRITVRFSPCHKVHCCITRKGNFIARIVWDKTMVWSLELHSELLELVKHLKCILNDLV